MDEFQETHRKNEDIAEKFQKIETGISSSGTVEDLFENLIIRIKEEFAIPFVWLSIVDRPEMSSLVRLLQSSEILQDHINIIDEKAFLSLTGGSVSPVLANEGLKPFYRLLPRNNRYLIRSLALAPLTLEGGIIGSINHGDPSAQRYQPGMDTTLLGQMAVKVSACLANMLPVAEVPEGGNA